MIKTQVNTTELVEADFREIKKLLEKKHELEVSTDYIRKVCKGIRTNSVIKAMAEDYITAQAEAKALLAKLAS